jgi:hypothetical protein
MSLICALYQEKMEFADELVETSQNRISWKSVWPISDCSVWKEEQEELTQQIP